MRDQNDEASSLILGHPIRAYRSATAGPSSAVWLVSQQHPLTIAAEKRELLSAAHCTVDDPSLSPVMPIALGSAIPRSTSNRTPCSTTDSTFRTEEHTSEIPSIMRL